MGWFGCEGDMLGAEGSLEWRAGQGQPQQWVARCELKPCASRPTGSGGGSGQAPGRHQAPVVWHHRGEQALLLLAGGLEACGRGGLDHGGGHDGGQVGLGWHALQAGAGARGMGGCGQVGEGDREREMRRARPEARSQHDSPHPTATPPAGRRCCSPSQPSAGGWRSSPPSTPHSPEAPCWRCAPPSWPGQAPPGRPAGGRE